MLPHPFSCVVKLGLMLVHGPVPTDASAVPAMAVRPPATRKAASAPAQRRNLLDMQTSDVVQMSRGPKRLVPVTLATYI
jgi:hypothetical protein